MDPFHNLLVTQLGNMMIQILQQQLVIQQLQVELANRPAPATPQEPETK